MANKTCSTLATCSTCSPVLPSGSAWTQKRYVAALQHAVTRSNMLQQRGHISGVLSLCHSLQHDATLCNCHALQSCRLVQKRYIVSLQHTATHCNALQHTVTHCNTLEFSCSPISPSGLVWIQKRYIVSLQHPATPCNTLQHTATYCNTLEDTATHFNTLQVSCSPISPSGSSWIHRRYNASLQQAATSYNALHHTTTHCGTLQFSCSPILPSG